ncbi:response regulator [Chamaesiphon minutus]|uniref:Response regulator containing a CheY-like receiver domain and a GGDEF domain n=1 Tax=Chamaesiphon minutus (strain ATCC 27169 / PCC 6605) TaxID=1173020 RepID=K9UJR7_CHAP6|nr:response regulator [Chamaesiphon minutus]AFY95322.1 response regulator containing a CheY-like receiver domain and a GGDEF domain [Chamaesiphon minutus PCC 6605]
MNQGSSSVADTERTLNPIKLLEQLATSQAKGCLRITANDIVWLLYFYEGKLFYANHSLEPIERLEQHLRRISPVILANQVYTDLREQLKEANLEATYPSLDYQAIRWLIAQGHISEQTAGTLVKSITKEVLQPYLLITSGTSELVSRDTAFPIWWSGNFLFVTKECQTELQAWQALQPAIQSPYQRPYLMNVEHPLLTPDVKVKLSKILIGFSFRQLSLLLKQDELTVANNLHRLINNRIVGLRPPQPPFERLHRLYTAGMESDRFNDKEQSITATLAAVDSSTGSASPSTGELIEQATYKIACVDDSPTILREINRFLDGDSFKVFPIVDSGTALMKIIRINPDIILLDVGMPTIDGYKLCSMLRKHPAFKKTPIVMVTGNTGIIDRAKAKMAGSTDYMTKPFTQAGLIEMVSRHLMAEHQ